MTVDGARIAVLVPAYNEERQIESVLHSVPSFVDTILVVDDASTDDTPAVVDRVATDDGRVRLISLDENRGVGGALAVAYTWARDEGFDIAVTLDGDGQMDPGEMRDLIEPILEGQADYTKGNRLGDSSSWKVIPGIRLFGNAVLSVLTKIASGYWGVADSQSGYTAAGRYALEAIEWEEMYPRYGRPNDVLVLANAAECRVADVPVRAIYGVGERSNMKIAKVVFAISFLLFRRFWWRMFHRYVLRDFHPLVFFYLFAFAASGIAVALAVRLFWLWPQLGHVPSMTALSLAFFTITALNSTFFAFWMDMEANRDLWVRWPRVRPVRVVGTTSSEEPERASAGAAPARDSADAGPGEHARGDAVRGS